MALRQGVEKEDQVKEKITAKEKRNPRTLLFLVNQKKMGSFLLQGSIIEDLPSTYHSLNRKWILMPISVKFVIYRRESCAFSFFLQMLLDPYLLFSKFLGNS